MTKTLIPFLVWEFSARDAIIDDQPFFDKAAAHLKYHHTIADNTIQFFVSKTGDTIIGIVGPEAIAGWLENHAFSSCPQEVFSDTAIKTEDGHGKEIFDKVINWFWHPEEELVYVTSEKQSHPITYGEWLEPTVKKIDETPWYEKVSNKALFKFVAKKEYEGTNPREFLKENVESFFNPVTDAYEVKGMIKLLEWQEDPDPKDTVIEYCIRNLLTEAVTSWENR